MIEHWTVTYERMRRLLQHHGAELHDDQGYVVAKWWGDNSRHPVAEIIFGQGCEIEEVDIDRPTTNQIGAFARTMARVDAALSEIEKLRAGTTEGPGLSSGERGPDKAGHTEADTSPKSVINGDSTTECRSVTARKDGHLSPIIFIPFDTAVGRAIAGDFVVEFHFGPDWYQLQHTLGKRQPMHRWRHDRYRGTGWSAWRDTSMVTLRQWLLLPARRVPVEVCENDPLERGPYPETT